MFTFGFYKGLIETIKNSGYTPTTFIQCKTVEHPAIIRHDIDMSPQKALEMAKFENQLGISSTYFVMISSDYYNLLYKDNELAIKKILDLGHEVGLHYDYTKYDNLGDDSQRLIRTVKNELQLLECILDSDVYSFSWHIPKKELIGAKLDISLNGKEIINAYDEFFINNYKYLSDSMMRWREPAIDIIQSRQHEKIHVLTHPIWYKETPIDNPYEIIQDEYGIRSDSLSRYCNLILPGFVETQR